MTRPVYTPTEKHPRVYSVSQAETWQQCNEKWWFLKIGGAVDAGTDATELGSVVHELMEPWLEQGVFPETHPTWANAHRLAHELIKITPAPHTNGCGYTLAVEEEKFLELGDVLFRGYADFVLRGKYLGHSGTIVGDHKTTSSFDWIKDLDTNLQSNLYAAMWGATQLRWGYVKTKGEPETRLVVHEPKAASVKKALAVLQDIGHRLEDAHQNPTKQQARNLSACDLFNKDCPALAQCRAKHRKVPNMSRFDRFRKNLDATKSTPAPAPETAPVAPKDAFGPVGGLSEAAKINAELKAIEAERDAQHKGVLSQKAIEAEIKAVQAKVDAANLVNDAEEDDASVEPSEPAPPVVETPKKRGRPAKVATQALEATVAKAQSAAGLQPTLYLGCRPDGEAPMAFAALASAAHEMVAAELGVPHYSAIDFGKGAGAFVHALEELLTGGAPGDLFVETNDRDWPLVRHLFVSKYRVVRGV